MSASRSTLYLLPGLLCDSHVWRPQAAALAADYEVRTPDFLPGDTLTEMARRILSQAPPRFAVAGHSMGGRVAMELAALAPDRLERIALLDTSAHPASPQEAAKRGALVALAFADGMDAVARSWLPPMLHPDRVADRALMSGLEAMVRRATPQIFRDQQNALLTRPDATAVLAKIAVPCAFIVGRQDGWSPPAQHEAMCAAVRGASLTVIEQCGHMATLEQPDAVTRALADWLRRGAR